VRRRCERVGVDTTEVTRVRWGLIREVPRQLWTASSARSTRAQAVLVFSAFLLGAVLGALTFVGIWRHTAAAGDRAQAAQTIAQQRLAETNLDLQRARQSIQAERALVARLRVQRGKLLDELTRLRSAAGGLPGRLQSISTDAATLSRSTSSLESELFALQAYLERPSATGIDVGFVTAQIRYLIRSTEAAVTNAAQLERQVRGAAAVAAPLSSGK
jgi:hypothetical protein